MKYKIYKIKEILSDLSNKISQKEPFSLIRFGDGGLKMMNSFYHKQQKNINIICEKEGIPNNKIDDIIRLWAHYANNADYIDSPVVYDGSFFWKRYKNNYVPINTGTQILLNDWEKIYNRISINTKDRKYCNPEFNWLSILNTQNNLLNLMKNKKICFISVFDKLLRLKDYDIEYVKVVGHHENQYKNSFKNILRYIDDHTNDYDIWLNSSGELGRIYSGRIKENGGRVIDMGFVVQYWNDFSRPARFEKFLNPCMTDSKLVSLTTNGLKFKGNI